MLPPFYLTTVPPLASVRTAHHAIVDHRSPLAGAPTTTIGIIHGGPSSILLFMETPSRKPSSRATVPPFLEPPPPAALPPIVTPPTSSLAGVPTICLSLPGFVTHRATVSPLCRQSPEEPIDLPPCPLLEMPRHCRRCLPRVPLSLEPEPPTTIPPHHFSELHRSYPSSALLLPPSWLETPHCAESSKLPKPPAASSSSPILSIIASLLLLHHQSSSSSPLVETQPSKSVVRRTVKGSRAESNG